MTVRRRFLMRTFDNLQFRTLLINQFCPLHNGQPTLLLATLCQDKCPPGHGFPGRSLDSSYRAWSVKYTRSRRGRENLVVLGFGESAAVCFGFVASPVCYILYIYCMIRGRFYNRIFCFYLENFTLSKVCNAFFAFYCRSQF